MSDTNDPNELAYLPGFSNRDAYSLHFSEPIYNTYPCYYYMNNLAIIFLT